VNLALVDAGVDIPVGEFRVDAFFQTKEEGWVDTLGLPIEFPEGYSGFEENPELPEGERFLTCAVDLAGKVSCYPPLVLKHWNQVRKDQS